MSLKDYDYLKSKIHIYEQVKEKPRLLQSDKLFPLSGIVSNEGKVKAIINCSYFDSEYVYGRNQGDLYNDTYSEEDSEKYYNLVIFKDGSYKFGKFSAGAYKQDIVAGFSPAYTLILNGEDVELCSTALCNKTKIVETNYHTAIAITKASKILLIKTDGGFDGLALKAFLKSKYDLELLCLLDGGGSSEMVVNGQIIGKLKEGRERLMHNGLALVEIDEPEPTPTNTPGFTERLNKEGLDGNECWYSNKLNPFAMNDLWLPNCTNYAFGRSTEIANKNIRNDLMDSYPNAQDWSSITKWKKGATPKLGAIGVWGGNKYGHVAIVERINDDGILFSQSNYARPINKQSSNYFETKLYKPVVGAVTSGVGLTFLGYIYNPYVRDLRTSKDTSKDQVEVLADLIRVRKTANGEKLQGRFCSKGLYNVLDLKEDGYLWAKLDDDLWIATNDKEGWTKTYLKEVEDPLIKENEELKKLNEDLQKEIENLNKILSELKNKLEEIKKIVG